MRIALPACIFLLLLITRTILFYRNSPHFYNGQAIRIQTTLLSEPQIMANYQRFYINFNGEKIAIIAPLYPEYHYADSLIISGTLKTKVINKKSFLSIYYPKIEAMKNKTTQILAITSSIRQKIIAVFERALPPTSAALLLGIVFGIKESMPKTFMENLRISGVLHVIAASGMNVTIAGGFLSSLFGFFFRRQIALILSIFGILFYAVLSGLEPSIIRASIMGILAFSAQILGRQRIASYGLILAAYVMIFVSPNIVEDVGFQLSFVATAGLLYIRPLFEKREKTREILKKSLVGEELVTTVSAQIATLPILLANFGTYSIWSILVNTLVLWTVPILMILGGVGAVFITFEAISRVFLYLCLPLLIYFEWVVNFFSSLKGVLKIENFPWQFAVGYYFFISSIILFLRKKKSSE